MQNRGNVMMMWGEMEEMEDNDVDDGCAHVGEEN